MEELGIDYRLLIAQLINFIVFFFIFKKFLARPLTHFIKEQKKNEQDKERIIADLRNKEEEALAQKQIIISEAQEQSRLIIKTIRQEADQIKKDIILKAQNDAEHIRNQTKQQMKDEKLTLYNGLKKDVIKTSSLMIKSVLRDLIDENIKRQITQKLIDTLEKTPLTASYEN